MLIGRTSVPGVVLSLVCVAVAAAQELSVNGGLMGSGSGQETSYAWELEFRHPLFDRHLAWSVAWLNEGHVAEHHRDGLVAQFWAVPVLDPDDFAFAIGAGMYRYADTRFWPGDGYTNEHGWAPIVSASATVYTDSPWFFRATINHVSERDGFESNSVVAGLGYQLGWKASARRERRPLRREQSLTGFFGKTVVNSRSSEQATAYIVEYRRMLAPLWDWTVSYLDEGDPTVMRRRGLATQVWFVGRYLQQRLALGLGAGPYFQFVREGPAGARADHDIGTSVLLTPTAAYNLGAHWQVRASWNRVLSRNNRDADVIVLGLGYRWGAR
jgi:hypothetical protein